MLIDLFRSLVSYSIITTWKVRWISQIMYKWIDPSYFTGILLDEMFVLDIVLMSGLFLTYNAFLLVIGLGASFFVFVFYSSLSSSENVSGMES